MRTLVTGGTGFIGGAVVRRLLEAGHEVKALVRPGADTRQLGGLPVEQVTGDLRHPESLRRGMTGCTWVFHVAALYSFWGYRWNDFYETNVEGTRLVLLQHSTNRRGRPQTDAPSGGRFLVLAPEYLERAIYRSGRALTVAGEVRGQRDLPVGETVYRYPLLTPREMYLWPEGDGVSPLFHFGFAFGFSKSL